MRCLLSAYIWIFSYNALQNSKRFFGVMHIDVFFFIKKMIFFGTGVLLTDTFAHPLVGEVVSGSRTTSKRPAFLLLPVVEVSSLREAASCLVLFGALTLACQFICETHRGHAIRTYEVVIYFIFNPCQCLNLRIMWLN